MEGDGGALVLLLAMVGGWFICVGLAHALVYAAWKFHLPMPEWMREHLHDEWGQK